MIACTVVLKKLFAISLTALLLFNLAGYRIWFYYQDIRSAARVQASLDRNEYDEKDLITIKVPISLPYFSNWNDFERYDGSIEVNGQHYNYVKRKVYNDTLVLLCLPNKEQNMLSESKSVFEGLVSNGQSPSHNKQNTSLLLNSFIFLFWHKSTSYLFVLPPAGMLNYRLVNNNFTATGLVAPPWRPPDMRVNTLM